MRKLKTILILITFILPKLLVAQFQENNAYYFEFDIKRGGEQNGVNFALNYIFKNKYSTQLKVGRHAIAGGCVPPDYIGSSWGKNGENKKPKEIIKPVELLIGKIVKLHKENVFRVNVKIGIGFNEFQIPYRFKHKTDLLFYNSNYTYETKIQKNIGFVINPSLDIAVTENLGLSFSPYANFNNYRTIYGSQFGVVIGFL